MQSYYQLPSLHSHGDELDWSNDPDKEEIVYQNPLALIKLLKPSFFKVITFDEFTYLISNFEHEKITLFYKPINMKEVTFHAQVINNESLLITSDKGHIVKFKDVLK